VSVKARRGSAPRDTSQRREMQRRISESSFVISTSSAEDVAALARRIRASPFPGFAQSRTTF